MSNTPTADEILHKWLNNTTVSGRDGVIEAMKEIAQLTWDAGMRHEFYGESQLFPNKEQFIKQLFPDNQNTKT